MTLHWIIFCLFSDFKSGKCFVSKLENHHLSNLKYLQVGFRSKVFCRHFQWEVIIPFFWDSFCEEKRSSEKCYCAVIHRGWWQMTALECPYHLRYTYVVCLKKGVLCTNWFIPDTCNLWNFMSIIPNTALFFYMKENGNYKIPTCKWN